MQRNPSLLADNSFDLLILGGGITGAGIALDATLRGWRVALIDKGDFASGTSSASSKLIHGGLRYLEQGQFRLVYEALHERRLLLANAPHLVRPLRFLIPFTAGSRVPPWQWRLGLTLYDLLAGRANLQRSGALNLGQLRTALPALQTDLLSGGAHYFDAQMDDARLCLAVLRTAARQGACIANYIEAVGFARTGQRLTGVRAVDRLSGAAFVIRARQIVNAAGPWVDAVCQLAGAGNGPLLEPTKGTHVLVPNQPGLSAGLLLLHPRDGRVFFVLPWFMTDPAQRPDKLLLGTTDTRTTAGPDGLASTVDEHAYLIEGFNHYFRQKLQLPDVLGSFAGLRPLLRARGGEPSSRSREFRVVEGPTGLISVVGGKYTTYRHMAEIVTDAVARRLGRRGPCRTQQYPLDEAPSEDWQEFFAAGQRDLAEKFGLTTATARHLLGRYGTHAADVARYLEQAPKLARPLVPGEPEIGAEWAYQRDCEMAVYPADHWLRRTRLGLYRPEVLQRSGAAGTSDPVAS